ncbi:DUF4350 domain-containing protein [Bacillus sp. JCM 19034]|uniref:DUF4350 domain-containing protein n=1 Tax=Bacillus sp. JCM 19034 TaxID=1481928 RepID=UPI000784CB70|nr:DUF4350 domain-containing protein [Bacillus sp. JCM 19034]
MDKQKTSKKAWVWLPILLIIFFVSSFIAIGQPPREYPAFLSHSPSPTGVKALYTYLDEELEAVKRWTHSPDMLTTVGGDQVLVMIEPSFIPSSAEMNEYEEFMAAGNTIMLFSENPAGMFGLRYDPLTYLPEDEPIHSKNEEFYADFRSPIRLVASEEDEILLEDDQGVIAFKRQVGDGYLMVINEAGWLVNQYILDEDHIPLILFLLDEAESASVLFDDYVHGAENATSMLSTY